MAIFNSYVSLPEGSLPDGVNNKVPIVENLLLSTVQVAGLSKFLATYWWMFPFLFGDIRQIHQMKKNKNVKEPSDKFWVSLKIQFSLLTSLAPSIKSTLVC